MLWLRMLVAIGLFLGSGAIVQARAAQDRWADFQFLMGAWVTAGDPAEGTGGFTLEPELQGKILVRRNQVDLPAAQGRPAGRHEDLMVIYRAPGGKETMASYYDNEDHVIQYAVSPLPGGKGLVFTSEADSSAPRFRLTYTMGEADTVAVRFEFAAPGPAGVFKTYLEGKARRASPAK
jgi:hypothetical protein